MDLGLSKAGDYAVRAAISLTAAFPNGRYRKIREIVEEMHLPRPYTPQILTLLVRAGLVEAKAGRDGGYRLTRDPREISLLEVVQAAEGDLVPTRCILRGSTCNWENPCPVHGAWVNAGDAFKKSLRGVTLASVAAKNV
jgi:Rrf2 family protein